ncbi:hypothetical protein NSU18_22640 [Paenibacillus sp. FSL H8-0048]|uniref:hypothetical protein n=1 Tax=Paenibacillus sp. FSL H8-0048 TaxID=2954508 RepID=UPI0030F72291
MAVRRSLAAGSCGMAVRRSLVAGSGGMAVHRSLARIPAVWQSTPHLRGFRREVGKLPVSGARRMWY